MVGAMTAQIPALKKIASINPASPEANKVPDLREEVLATTAVGFGISGMVLRAIRMEVQEPDRRRELVTDVYTKVDWLRRGAGGQVDPVWTDGGVLDGEAIKAARANIFTSTARILQRIGLQGTKRVQRYLEPTAEGEPRPGRRGRQVSRVDSVEPTDNAGQETA